MDIDIFCLLFCSQSSLRVVCRIFHWTPINGEKWKKGHWEGSLAVVRSYAPGYEPLVTGNLAMGLTIRSSHKQELSSVYQFIDVLYSLCIYEALWH